MAHNPSITPAHAMGNVAVSAACATSQQLSNVGIGPYYPQPQIDPASLQAAMDALKRAPIYRISSMADAKNFLEAAQNQAKWHMALLKVIEWFQAQVALKMFADGTYAQTIFEEIVARGLNDLINNPRPY